MALTTLELALSRECDAAVTGDAHASGAGELARRVQRTLCEPEGTARASPRDAERWRLLRLAAVHHARARALLALADQYTDAVWDAMPRPRRFFCLHRGFGPADDRRALPAYRALFLRVALGAAERAAELAGPESLECCCLVVCVLWALTAHRERDDAGWCVRLLRACQAGLAPGCGDHHAAELAALYGERAACAAPAADRRALLAAVEAIALKLVRARDTMALHRARQMDAPDGLAAPLAAVASAEDSLPAWTPWSSPWQGLQPIDSRSGADDTDSLN